jgi:iron complex transport system ATP-binding protein
MSGHRHARAGDAPPAGPIAQDARAVTAPGHALPPEAAALVADGLGVSLGGRPVLERVSLALQPGTWTAIVGPNGAGKSTLLSVLAGLRRADAGTVALCGRPLAAWPARDRARRLAWLSQHGEAEGELAARDVAMLGRLPHHGPFGAPDAADVAAVDAAMRETECEAFGDRRLSTLSGGERQRVLLARVLAVQAPVMLLDEPTTHLDAPHQRTLLRSLRRRAREGAAIAAVLHDLTLALRADRVAVLADGRLRAQGPPADPTVRTALVEVFGHAIRLEPTAGDDGVERWIAVPTD